MAGSDPGIPRQTVTAERIFAASQQSGLQVLRAVSCVVRGQPRAITMIGCALLAGGHALIEDSPGTGKTTLARSFAAAVGGSFARIQGTVDLMPSDITGSSVWEAGSAASGNGHFRFVPGPLFASVVMVDELNRTAPRTQSAFLEAMEEHAVTVDGVRHPLPEPFFVIATQNPREHHGTFALPLAQLDRFAVTVSLDPLDAQAESLVLREQLVQRTVDSITPVLQPGQLRQLQQVVRSLHVADAVVAYAVELAARTRHDQRLTAGVSTRAVLVLLRVAQAHALLHGRTYTAPDDVKAVAGAVLAHRLTPVTTGPGADPHTLIAELLARTPVAD